LFLLSNSNPLRWAISWGGRGCGGAGNAGRGLRPCMVAYPPGKSKQFLCALRVAIFPVISQCYYSHVAVIAACEPQSPKSCVRFMGLRVNSVSSTEQVWPIAMTMGAFSIFWSILNCNSP